MTATPMTARLGHLPEFRLAVIAVLVFALMAALFLLEFLESRASRRAARASGVPKLTNALQT